MSTTHRSKILFGASVALALAAPALAGQDARNRAGAGCAVHAAYGTGHSPEIARFQAFEGVLKRVGGGAWASWMASGQLDGLQLRSVKYQCRGGTGLGVTCQSRAKICRT